MVATTVAPTPLRSLVPIIPDGDDVVADYVTTSGGTTFTRTASYVGGLGIDSKYVKLDGAGSPTYYVPDALGSVGVVIDAAGTVQDARLTNAWGEQLRAPGPDRYGYTQREAMPEIAVLGGTAAQYFRARTLFPELGRLGQRDPAESLARSYRYASNQSTGLVDPTGRESWRVDEANCTITLGITVDTNFKGNWTLQRKAFFRGRMKRTIETTWNGAPYRFRAFRYETPMNDWSQKRDSPDPPCMRIGFAPRLEIQFTPFDEWSSSEDWEVDVEANPTAVFMRSGTRWDWSWLDEADVLPTGGAGTQVPVVHEFGHFLGLGHPGEGMGPAANAPGEYTHTGLDIRDRMVDGPRDLMGTGAAVNRFYFDKWRHKLNELYIEQYRDMHGYFLYE